MAKKVWVYTLDNQNISPAIEDVNEITEKNPMIHHIYVAPDNHPQVANDGSKPLFHSASGIIEPSELDEIVKNYSSTPIPPPTLTGISITVPAKGAEGSSGQVVVTPVPAGATLPALTYASSHQADVGVDATGKLTFVKGVYAHITVTGGGFSKSEPTECTNANATGFTSATNLANGYEVHVTLSDANGYGSVKSEWALKVNGADVGTLSVSGHGTNTFRLDITDSSKHFKAGDTITVSHKVAGSGIAKFIDKPVTNIMV